MTGFSVHTAETLLGVAELRWRAANKAAHEAQDEYDTARRLYASARSDCVAHGAATPSVGAADADE